MLVQQADDLHALERVRSYIQLSSAISPPPSEEAAAHSLATGKTSIPVLKDQTQARTHEAAEAAHLYALFTQATAVLEKEGWAGKC